MKIDYSQLQTYITCPRKYCNKYIKRLRRIKYDERSVDKDFGKCVHKAIKLMHTHHSLQPALDWFKSNFFGLDGEKVKTPAHGLILLTEYYNYYQAPKNELSDVNLTYLEIETVNSFKIGNVEYLVKMDGIAKNNAGHWYVERKTTKSLPYNFFNQFTPNMQISGGCDCIRRKYGQCSGAIIDALSMGYRSKSYKGKPAGFWFKPVREIVNRDKEQLLDFEKNVLEWTARLNDSLFNESFPKNEDACMQFRGCQFRELCTSCDDEQIQETLYEEHDPFEYLKEDLEV